MGSAVEAALLAVEKAARNFLTEPRPMSQRGIALRCALLTRLNELDAARAQDAAEKCPNCSQPTETPGRPRCEGFHDRLGTGYDGDTGC